MTNQEYHIPTVALIEEGGGEHAFLSLEGIIELSTWKDFQRKFGRHATYKRNDDYKRIRLSIGGNEIVENPVITKEHVIAYEFILQNQEQLKKNILNRLLIEYPNLQEQYDYDGGDAKELMPNVDSIRYFDSLIELSSVYILNVSREGVAYVGFSFMCTWDDEHGLGLMTHKEKVIEIGGADTAFLTWIAEKDLKANAESEANYRQTSRRKAKPRWKFW